MMDTLLFALERLWQHRLLVLLCLVGLAAAATLALSLPLYVDAVNIDLLDSRLDEPPYAFRFRYVGSWEGNITRADFDAADRMIRGNFVRRFEFPVQHEISYVRGRLWNTRRADDQPLGSYGLGVLSGISGQIEIVAGQWPSSTAEALPVLVAEALLYEMGLQVDDVLTMARPGGDLLRVQIAALWRPRNPRDPTWIFRPGYFDNVFLVEAEDLWEVLDGLESPIEEAGWFLSFDGSTIRTADVPLLLEHISTGERDVINVLPGTRMDVSPTEELQAFRDEVEQLTRQLVTVLVPVGGLIYYFVAVMAGLVVSRQQHEDIVLRSRGMSRRAILRLHLLMWLILAGIALGVGMIAAPLVVQLVGRTSSFLQFDNPTPFLQVQLRGQAIAIGALTSFIAASAGLLKAWRTSRQTITGFRQNMTGRPWWQRAYLDVLFMIPAAYVFYTLRDQGGISTSVDEPFSDPLTFLGPTLFALGLTLFFLRVWPFMLRLVAIVVSYGRGVALLMALRELTRSGGRYRGALLMMCFTLSLAGYTASMAGTIDRSLEDTVNYRIGADSVLVMAADAKTEQDEDSDDATALAVVGFNTLPASDLLNIEGVSQVSRVGRYPARMTVAGARPEGILLGVDRASIAAVMHQRDDYAPESFAELFNRLAVQRDGVLVSATAMETYSLAVGQDIAVQVGALGNWYDMRVPILGVVEYFPTLDPSEDFFLIANMDPIFELVGTELPHDIWLSLSSEADAVQTQVRELDYPVLEWRDPDSALAVAKAAPSRRGVLGFLSVGFVASIVLTLIVAITQNAASFRAQALQLGSLRAIGMPARTVGAYLLFSQGLATASGIIGGTCIGVLTTLAFLPLLDFSSGLPPYLVRVAWDEITLVYGLFAVVLTVVLFVTTLLMGRERLSTVVKLGDAG